MRQLTRITIGIIFTFFMLSTAQALVVYDPANFVQNRIAALNSLRQLVNQAQELQNQVNALRMQMQNLAHTPQIIWHKTWQDIQSAVPHASAQALSYTQEQKQLKDFFNKEHMEKQFAQKLHGWSSATLETLNNTQNFLAKYYQQLQAENDMHEKLQHLNENASGNLQVLQTANMFASAQVDQLQKLKIILMSQIQAQNSFYGYQMAKEQAQQENLNRLVTSLSRAMPQYGHGQGYGGSNFPTL